MTAPHDPIAVTVVGDVIVDRHFYHSDEGVIDVAGLGGAAGLKRLIDETDKAADKAVKAAKEAAKAAEEAAKAAAQLAKFDRAFANAAEEAARVAKVAAEAAEKLSKDSDRKTIAVSFGITTPDPSEFPAAGNAFAVWAPYKQSAEKGAPSVWRAARPMGYGSPERSPVEFRLTPAPRTASRILVLDDGGFDFRQRANEALWNLPAEGETRPDWIILKMSRPVGHGDLWRELTPKFDGQLVCVVSANELRDESVVLSKGASWEAAIEDLGAALATNPVLKTLGTCRHLVVNFSIDGALWIDRTEPDAHKATLIFDPERAEGEWGEKRQGVVFGYLTCMAAAVAHAAATQVAQGNRDLDLASAIRAGLSAMRDLLENGHGAVGQRPTGYPFARLAGVIAEPKGEFSIAPIVWPRAEAAAEGPWMMASDGPGASDSARPSVILGLARQIVINGYNALRGVPHAKFGKLVTADRSEIEALRGLRQILGGYKAKADAKKPLSIGVFGPPGAGKSFGVEQLATEVFGDKAWLAFNLSQFEGPADLVGAFHQVRDKALSGETPVVFWDEFDSRAYFWLQYLLAPMQDGNFQDGQLNHAIGKCVFVFAGGTSVSFDGFKPKGDNKESEAKAEAEFKLKKGPDFKSRLDGYYDVLGPNQRRLSDGPEAPPDPTDRCASLRRGLFLRSKLAGERNDPLDIDSDLLDALLMADRYIHGARSLEKLIEPLKPDRPGRPIRRSSLPPSTRLAMYVGEKNVNDILNRNTVYRISDTVIDKLAEAIHERWRENAGPEAAPFNVPYSELAPNAKEDNRAAARRMPDVLALVGLGLATAEEAKSMVKPTSAYIEAQIDRLGEAEHNGWMAQRAKNGWTYGTPRDNAKKLHPLMIPYSQLPKDQKEKDRDSVRDYVANAEAAGFAVVWLATDDPKHSR